MKTLNGLKLPKQNSLTMYQCSGETSRITGHTGSNEMGVEAFHMLIRLTSDNPFCFKNSKLNA